MSSLFSNKNDKHKICIYSRFDSKLAKMVEAGPGRASSIYFYTNLLFREEYVSNDTIGAQLFSTRISNDPKNVKKNPFQMI